MVTVELFGFKASSADTLTEVISNALDRHGLKASGVVIFHDSRAVTCLDKKPYPYVVVRSHKQDTIDTVAAELKRCLGAPVIKGAYQAFIEPKPEFERERWAR